MKIPWLDTYGEQRFVMTIGAGIVDTLLLVTKHIAPSDYVTLTVATVGAFIAATTWENVKSQPTTKPEAE